ncbi:DUF637 domain-containing protein [Pseudomonas poae]|uniref:DUF637 domain-containing protein n=1 Tax=Pseudomonas poae TaxID=200451 RepID=UPI0030D049E0
MAWLKDAEQRGDVDWRQVKEIHDSFKYSNSGLGPASQLIIAIVMATVLGPLAAGAMGTATEGLVTAGTLSAGTAAGISAATGAVAAGAATNARVSVINNRGNLGAVFKDVTSSDAIKGYFISGVTAGLTAGLFDGWTGTETVNATGKIVTVPGALGTWAGVGQFAANQVLQNTTSTLLGKALGQGGDLGDALKGALFNTLAAASFNAIGDYTQGVLTEGYPPKVIVHAMVGGLLSKATGGDFKTGALAAGINEALVVQLDTLVKGDKNLVSMSSQIVGVLAAASQKDADAKSIEQGGWVAKNATQYNYLNHDQLRRAAKMLLACGDDECRKAVFTRYKELSFAQDLEAAAACSADVTVCAKYSREVANTMANLDDIHQTLGDGPAQEWEDLRQSNLGFQEMLATFTAGHTAGAIAEAVQQKWGLSDEQTKIVADNLVLVAAGGVAAIAAKKALAQAFGGAKAIPESSYPSLAKPSPNAPSNVILGELDSLGRPTGVTAVLREDSLGGGSSANPAIRPPGFEGQPANHARGHLLANSLGGAGDDARNLVTLFQRNANHPNMSSFERQVRGAVQSGETVSYRAVPIYTGTNPMPTGVTLSARGSGGFTLDVSIPNVSGVK